jgi:hypothetical protein
VLRKVHVTSHDTVSVPIVLQCSLNALTLLLLDATNSWCFGRIYPEKCQPCVFASAFRSKKLSRKDKHDACAYVSMAFNYLLSSHEYDNTLTWFVLLNLFVGYRPSLCTTKLIAIVQVWYLPTTSG